VHGSGTGSAAATPSKGNSQIQASETLLLTFNTAVTLTQYILDDSPSSDGGHTISPLVGFTSSTSDDLWTFSGSYTGTTFTFGNAGDAYFLRSISFDPVSTGPIPEPQTISLTGIGLVLAGLQIRRRKNGRVSL
jgi:hypothetical protein